MREPDRRTFMAGWLAAGVTTGLGLAARSEALAAAAAAVAHPEDPVLYFVRDGSLLAFPTVLVWATSWGNVVEEAGLVTRDDRLIHLPAGEFWVEIDGMPSWAFRRRPCTAHPLAFF